MGKETLRIMDRYHQNKKRLNVLYEDRMVLENFDFIKAKDYTSELENSRNPTDVKSDKKTSLSDKILRLINKKDYVNFEIDVLKAEIQLVDNAIKALETEDGIEIFRARHLQKKSVNAASTSTGYSKNGGWMALRRIEEEFERLIRDK